MSFMNKARQYGARAAAGVATFSASAYAMAVDTGDVKTAIEAAASSAHTVGGYVVAAVAGLVAVGLIISIVRKL